MTKLINAPIGVPEARWSQNNEVMSETKRTSTGWRKPTPGLAIAEQHAQVGEQMAIPKARAIVACKKVGAAIGLKAGDLLLLDTLAAFAQPQDWEQGRRPIVWASNTFLIEQLGWSLSALRRHIRRLCEAGVITMKDSPNGKRWGRRDENGHIVEAYGFDLAPMAARTEEFEALYAAMKRERLYCASLRNTITVTRRIIRAKIEQALGNHLPGPWPNLKEAFEELLQLLPRRPIAAQRLQELAALFTTLKGRVEQTFEAAFDWMDKSDEEVVDKPLATSEGNTSDARKMAPTDTISDTHILTTNQLDPVNSNPFETNHAESADYESKPSEQVEKLEEADLNIPWSTHTKRRKSDLNVSILMQSCPQFAEIARSLFGYLNNWRDVHRAAGQMRGIVGLSEEAWNIAQRVFGPEIAAAVIALIYDKHAAGEVLSPGGYLRGMVEKARAGELHLERSFYGRLNRNAA